MSGKCPESVGCWGFQGVPSGVIFYEQILKGSVIANVFTEDLFLKDVLILVLSCTVSNLGGVIFHNH